MVKLMIKILRVVLKINNVFIIKGAQIKTLINNNLVVYSAKENEQKHVTSLWPHSIRPERVMS